MQKEKGKTIKNIMNEYVKKPSTPLIVEGQEELTKQDYERRLFVEEQLSSVGISTTVFDGENMDCENPYILEAILLVNQGKVIPEALREQIKKCTCNDEEKEQELAEMKHLMEELQKNQVNNCNI